MSRAEGDSVSGVTLPQANSTGVSCRRKIAITVIVIKLVIKQQRRIAITSLKIVFP
jgi:hypothetical protein